MSADKWPTPWRRPGEPKFPVYMRTTRDREGVYYEVSVSDGSDCYEGGEDEVVVWSTERQFGQREETIAGGAAFQYAAREQERIASEWVKALERAAGVLP